MSCICWRYVSRCPLEKLLPAASVESISHENSRCNSQMLDESLIDPMFIELVGIN